MNSSLAPDLQRRGLMFVLSSPSGAGKTTLSRRLLESHDDLSLSVSATTRPIRPGETDGVDYHFLSEDAFREMRERGEFLESATVFGREYGTPKAPVEAALAAGRDVLFDIDWQGARQLEVSAAADLVTVFILPPSKAELARRLRTRAQDSEEEVARRMAKAGDEISHWAEYEYVIINTDLDEAERKLNAILSAERLKRRRRVGLSDFVRNLELPG